MAARKFTLRYARRARLVVRRAPSLSALAARKEAKRDMHGNGGLMIGGVKDPEEQTADQVADRIMRVPAATPVIYRRNEIFRSEDRSIRRASKEADDEEMANAKFMPNAPMTAAGARTAPVPDHVSRTIRSIGQGEPLARAERSFFEPRFKTDLSSVRIHDGPAAHQAAKSIQARAFTLGRDIVFAGSEHLPQTNRGRRLMAHELAHVVSGHRSLRRKEDLCPKMDAAGLRLQFEAEAAAAKTENDDNRAVLAIKQLRRCDPTADDAYVSGVLAPSFGAKKTEELLAAGKTALGGHVGFYPGYAGDIKSRLKEMGVTDAQAHKTFATSARGRTHQRRAARRAAGALAQLKRADIVYFRGHQFAQYRAPGMFTDGAEERGVDLRYLQRTGGFPKVKLMISTSCATLCNEALSVFNSLFPKAAIFGYGRSAPLHGSQVRREFGRQVRALKSPLLMESTADIAKLAGAWKATIQKRHPNKENAKATRPGYFFSNLFYWTGSAWEDGKKGQPENKCKRKDDFSRQYPPPP